MQPAAVSAPDAKGADAKKADEGKTRKLEALPEAKEARTQLVEAQRLARKGDTKAALLLLDKVLGAFPTHRDALSEKTRICMQEKLYDEALFTISVALGQDADDSPLSASS
jgi:tetratricopeptide (TPR) repeat protein